MSPDTPASIVCEVKRFVLSKLNVVVSDRLLIRLTTRVAGTPLPRPKLTARVSGSVIPVIARPLVAIVVTREAEGPLPLPPDTETLDRIPLGFPYVSVESRLPPASRGSWMLVIPPPPPPPPPPLRTNRVTWPSRLDVESCSPEELKNTRTPPAASRVKLPSPFSWIRSGRSSFSARYHPLPD